MVRLLLLCLLASVVAGCGATSEPTALPPTQTPWIVVVTATPGTEREVAQTAQATQTPWIIVATPTRRQKATAAPVIATPATGKVTEEVVEPTTTTTTTTTTAPTVQPPAPTQTVSLSSLKYGAPKLLEPHPERRVNWNSTLLLKWTAVGELAADEYYHLHIERPPPTEGVEWWGDYVFTKDTQTVLQKAFLVPFHLAKEHGTAQAYWWVRVVRKTGEDDTGKPVGVDVGLPSDRRTLILESRP